MLPQSPERGSTGARQAFALRVTRVGAAATAQAHIFWAEDLAAAMAAAMAEGWQVQGLASEASTPDASKRRGLALPLFTQQLLALLEAGLTLPEALGALVQKETEAGAAAQLRGLLDELQQGRPLSHALEQAAFPPVYVALVRAAETTGELTGALRRMLEHLQQVGRVRKVVASAALYPAMLVGVGLLVLMFLIGYVVPRFATVYEGNGQALPAATEGFLALGRWIHDHAALAAGAGLTVLTGIGLTARRLGLGGMLALAAKLLPGSARRAAEFRSARFMRSVGLLLEAGLPLPRAMAMSADLLGVDQQSALQAVQQAVQQGRTFSDAMGSQGLAGPVALSLLRVGERSGQQSAMLLRAAQFAEAELEQWIERASRLLEPLLMLFIGAVVGGVVVLMYLPIFDLAGALN